MMNAGGSVFAQRLLVALTAALLACPAGDDANDSAADSSAATDAADSTGGANAEGATADSNDPNACPNGIVGMGTDGQSNPLMETWGSPCMEDADCVAALGEGAICQTMAVVYELPGGYCSRPCTLPDSTTRVVRDAMDCDPAGGIACVGLKGFFESCTPLCTDDLQCNREGYLCRQLPMISEQDDPTACLMPDCCENTCE